MKLAYNSREIPHEPYTCPECGKGKMYDYKKLHDGIWVHTYTCGTKMTIFKNRNVWTKKIKACREIL